MSTAAGACWSARGRAQCEGGGHVLTLVTYELTTKAVEHGPPADPHGRPSATWTGAETGVGARLRPERAERLMRAFATPLELIAERVPRA